MSGAALIILLLVYVFAFWALKRSDDVKVFRQALLLAINDNIIEHEDELTEAEVFMAYETFCEVRYSQMVFSFRSLTLENWYTPLQIARMFPRKEIKHESRR